MLQRTADVIVIGAGVIGCSTAYHLAKMGVQNVVVLEREQVGAGASSQSAAMLSLQFCEDELTARMARYSYERFMCFEEEMGVSIDFHRTGWMNVATEATAEQLRRQVKMLQGQGITSELLHADDVRRLYPELNTTDIVLGSWGPDDGPFDPHMIMSGYIKRARQMGVSVIEGVSVQHIMVEGNKVRGVVTEQGPISCPVVVNAAGPWAGAISQSMGITLPLNNSTRTIVVTNPIPGIPSDRPFIQDLTSEWYVRPELDGVLMGMGKTRITELDVQLDERQVETIIDVALHRVPALQRASILTAWTGIRPFTTDGRPILSVVPNVGGFLINCGWGGIGIIMAPLAGQLMAELVLGETTTMAVDELSITRFTTEDGLDV